MTALLWATFSPATPTFAETEKAVWNGDNLLYANHPYYQQADAKKDDSHGLTTGTHYYVYLEEVTNNPDVAYKAHVIYFSPGTDPPTAEKATYIEYDYSATKEYSNPTGKKAIDITARSDATSYSSCAVQGVGWFICPIAVFMADSMDNIFNFVAQFFAVQPVSVANTNSPLYVGWNVMRSIANVAFIIVFIIIIYSQLTSAGVSNYGLKKLLPRLIVAAILVNLSFFICAIAVDLSNIFGYSLQDIFIQIRQSTFNITDDSWSADTTTWATITAFVLSGGAVGVIGIAVAGDIIGALPLLLPILLGVVLTCLVVLIILAARQAIIVLLIVLAPLAFVAYLLPNTEKWFTKWRELFMTMLIFFPAFSLVFGGSQLAGGLIIQSASNVIMIIFGLAVQVAPLVITPLLLRLSGGLLGKIAGLVNDPRKGILDRSKNWANDRAGANREKSLTRTGRPNPFRKVAQLMDNSNVTTKRRRALYATMNESRYNRTTKAGRLHEAEASAKFEKERVENTRNTETQHLINTRGSFLNTQAIQTEQTKASLEAATESTNAMYSEYRAGGYNTGGNQRLNRLQSTMASQVIDTAIQKQRNQSAQNVQINEFADILEKNLALQNKAGGIDPNGAQRALAVAIAAQTKAHGEAVSNASTILSHNNYGDDVIGKIALGKTRADDSRIQVNVTKDMREAAIAKIAGGGNTVEIMKLMENLEINPSDDNMDFRQTFADTLLANSNKPKFAGAGIIANIKQGQEVDENGNVKPIPPVGKARLDTFIAQTINADKLGGADVLVNQDKDYLFAVLRTLQNNESDIGITADAKAILKKSIQQAQSNPIYSQRIGERKNVLESIKKLL